MVSNLLNLVCFILLRIKSSFFLIYFLFGFVLQIIRKLERGIISSRIITYLLTIIVLCVVFYNLICFYFLIPVALGLVSFPLLIIFRVTKKTKFSIFVKFVYGYLAMIGATVVYLQFSGLISSLLHLALFFLLGSLLFALNYFMFVNNLRRWYSFLMITFIQILVLFLIRFSVLLLITIFGIFLVYFIWFMIAAFFHRKVIYYIENMNYGFNIWLKTFLLSFSVLALRLACSDSFIPSDIYILGPLPLILAGSNGSLHSGFSLFSKTFSTQNQVPILAIKNCNKHESELLQAVWSGNGKSILQKSLSLVKSGNWISTRTEIQNTRNNFIRANNVSYDYTINKEISDFVKTRGVIFEVDSIASSQVLLKHVLRMYKNHGISSNGIKNVTDYVISEDMKTDIITAENKICAVQLAGRVGGVSINNFEIIRGLNELPQLMELSHRTGLLSKVYRPGEVLDDWCTRDSKGNLCFTEAKTYSNFSNTDPLEYVSKEDYNVFLNAIKDKNNLCSIVYSDGKIMKEAFDFWSKGIITNTNMELLVYVPDAIDFNSDFYIPSTNKTMSLNVRSLHDVKNLDEMLFYDVRGLSCKEFDIIEKQNQTILNKELEFLRQKVTRFLLHQH